MEEHKMFSELPNIDVAELKKALREFLDINSSKKLSLFITGQTGVGKSRLVNALVGKNVAEEGRERKRGCTRTVTKYSVHIHGIKVLVFDSPGLQDRTVENEDEYLEEAKQKGFDLMIYCTKMDDKRFTEADEMAIRTLTRVFGKEVWKKSVIALTFANKIEDPDEGDEEVYFKDEYRHWKEAIDDFLRNDRELELGLDSQVLGAIPITPTGNYRKLQLPTSDNWLSELFMSCFFVMDAPTALTLYKLNEGRFAFPSRGALTAPPRSLKDETTPPVDSDTTQGAASVDASDEIPEAVTLNKKQEKAFFEKLRTPFLDYVKTLKGDSGIKARLMAILGPGAVLTLVAGVYYAGPVVLAALL